MYNKIILLGHLTADPELRYTPQGTPVCTARLASNTRYSQDGKVREETLFINAIIFGKQAETITKYFQKGSPVLVEGRLRENTWESGGQKKSRMEVIASIIRMLPKAAEKIWKSDEDEKKEVDFSPEEISDTEPF